MNTPKNKLITPPSVGDKIPIGYSTISTPSMGGYPYYTYQNIIICEDGYQLKDCVTDMLGNITSKSETYIEKGFFAKSSFNEIADKLNTVAQFNTITPWDFLERNELQQLIVYEHISMNVDISNKNALVFNMCTNRGEKYKFLYTGYMMHDPAIYHPAYWFYLCEMQGKYYMLIFYDSVDGALWECLEITENESEELTSGELPLWIEIAFAAHKNNNRIPGIHLESLNDTKYLLPRFLRGQYITDADYYGI